MAAARARLSGSARVRAIRLLCGVSPAMAVALGGRITEIGSHEELLAAGGAYAQMFTLQASRYAVSGPKDSGDV